MPIFWLTSFNKSHPGLSCTDFGHHPSTESITCRSPHLSHPLSCSPIPSHKRDCRTIGTTPHQERWECQTQCIWVLQKMTDIISATQTCCNKSKILYIVSVKKTTTYFCTKTSTRKKSSLDLHSNKYSLSPQKKLLWLRRVAMVTKTVWMYQDKHMLSDSIKHLKQHPGKTNKKQQQTNKQKSPPQFAGSGIIYTTHLFFSFLFVCVHNTLIQSTQDWFKALHAWSYPYMSQELKNCTQMIHFLYFL